MSYAVSDEARENATRNREGAGRCPHGDGDWLAGYMSAFRSWLVWAPGVHRRGAQAVRASMSLTSANGGYALPFLLDPTRSTRVRRRRTRSGRSLRVESGTSGQVERRDRVQRDHRMEG